MPRRVPHEHVVFALEIRDLPVKQPVIGRQTRQEDQSRRVFLELIAGPIVDGPAGRIIVFFNHESISDSLRCFYHSRKR